MMYVHVHNMESKSNVAVDASMPQASYQLVIPVPVVILPYFKINKCLLHLNPLHVHVFFQRCNFKKWIKDITDIFVTATLDAPVLCPPYAK